MQPFVHETHPVRVIFGTPLAEALPAEVARLGLRRLLVLSTPEQAAMAQQAVGNPDAAVAGLFSGARMHTPVDVTQTALAEAARLGIDGILSFGGGSTIGLGKAVAIRTGLPHLAVPTTYAGSEMTPILGETADGVKTTRRDPAILPRVVIYDVALTLGLPVPMSVTSGMNAIAHAAEALYARDRNPVTDIMAEQGIAAMACALPRLVASPADADARADALYAAWLCGACLGAVGMSLHHKLAHVLGGRFDLPHAALHTAVLPHAIAYNASAAPTAMEAISRALGGGDPAEGLYRLARNAGATMALRDLGMPEQGIAVATEMTMKNPYWSPRPLEPDAIRDLLAKAWAGNSPSADEGKIDARL